MAAQQATGKFIEFRLVLWKREVVKTGGVVSGDLVSGDVVARVCGVGVVEERRFSAASKRTNSTGALAPVVDVSSEGVFTQTVSRTPKI
jgi:hypothetical protein